MRIFLFFKSLIKAYFNLNWIIGAKYNTSSFMQEIIWQRANIIS